MVIQDAQPRMKVRKEVKLRLCNPKPKQNYSNLLQSHGQLWQLVCDDIEQSWT